jgi:hypothetical protein
MYTVITSVTVAVSASELIALSLLPRQKSNPHSSKGARVSASNFTINKALGQLADTGRAGLGGRGVQELDGDWEALDRPALSRASPTASR